MTREEVLRTLNEIEEKVEEIERTLQKNVKVMHKNQYSKISEKKQAVMERIESLEKGADFLLSAAPESKMVQSFNMAYEPV
ncbi:hypothetical protein [Bacillus thermotolerans]|uniref:Uncharacterized protein n=1 Tax=Bacillus thermotolerans TaxID=1221996 RepID=A0A0F5HWC0_BACTR|nr:hypothetical protein [Bacillus thermotolerans]KKB37679.1 hypothetical protein QY95_02789 [Bacillus thermotolerans]